MRSPRWPRWAYSSAALDTNSFSASFGVPVDLAGDEHRLGQVPDPKPHLLRRHAPIVRTAYDIRSRCRGRTVYRFVYS
jgi:hypothetical protein